MVVGVAFAVVSVDVEAAGGGLSVLGTAFLKAVLVAVAAGGVPGAAVGLAVALAAAFVFAVPPMLEAAVVVASDGGVAATGTGFVSGVAACVVLEVDGSFPDAGVVDTAGGCLVAAGVGFKGFGGESSEAGVVASASRGLVAAGVPSWTCLAAGVVAAAGVAVGVYAGLVAVSCGGFLAAALALGLGLARIVEAGFVAAAEFVLADALLGFTAAEEGFLRDAVFVRMGAAAVLGMLWTRVGAAARLSLAGLGFFLTAAGGILGLDVIAATRTRDFFVETERTGAGLGKVAAPDFPEAVALTFPMAAGSGGFEE